MATVIVSLPEHDRELVKAIADLQRLVDEALESGVSDRSLDDVLAEAPAEVDALGIT